MLEKTTRLLSETLVRAMDRRLFLRRSGETVFAGVAALASGHMLSSKAAASASKPPLAVPRCSPPGPYCNLTGVNQPDGCHGGSCFQHMVGSQVYQCRVYYQYYQAGCWTTAVTGGYWTCCDCECGSPRVATCGCAQYNVSPDPRPDKVGAGVSA